MGLRLTSDPVVPTAWGGGATAYSTRIGLKSGRAMDLMAIHTLRLEWIVQVNRDRRP